MFLTTALGLANDEVQLFEELNKVMEKYPHLNRKFGITLAHSHFEIGENEILHETHSVKDRTLSVRTIDKSEVKNAHPTQWIFKEDGTIQVAQYCCDQTED